MLGTGKLLGYVHQHGWVYWQRPTQKINLCQISLLNDDEEI